MEKNIILYVGNFPREIDAIRTYGRERGRTFRVALLHDTRRPPAGPTEKLDIILSCDLDSPERIARTIIPFHDELLAVTCADERSVRYFQKVIPHVPYLNTPTSESLTWATSKIEMRKRLAVYDKTISPKYMVVHDAKKKTMKEVEERIGFPLLIKPTGLASSMLVNLCYHPEEFGKALKMIFRKIRTTYKEADGRGEPTILVEEFMEGKMYSVDAYVDGNGEISFCPMVFVKTGKAIGFDDFFGYERITPTMLSDEDIALAGEVAKKAIYALGLRSTSAHIELMRTPAGWRIIELGPRIGGYRHMMYMLSYGINHAMNDVLVRIPEKPVLSQKVKGYTAAFMFFAQKEGKLTKLGGIKKAQELESFAEIRVNKKIGDMCRFAKNGGSYVLVLILFNKERAALLADIRRLEQTICIETV